MVNIKDFLCVVNVSYINIYAKYKSSGKEYLVAILHKPGDESFNDDFLGTEIRYRKVVEIGIDNEEALRVVVEYKDKE